MGLPLQNFIASSLPTIKAVWLNRIDAFVNTLFNSATTPQEARTALGSGAIGDLLFQATTQSQALSEIGAVGRLLNIQVITTTQVYVPTTGTNQIIARGRSAGGAGGGCPATGANQVSVGGGGGAGAFGELWLTSGITGLTATLGAAGISVLGAAGGNAGSLTFGTMTLTGGQGGGAGTAGAQSAASGGNGGTSSNATINGTGEMGGNAIATFATTVLLGGRGGSTSLGSGANGGIANITSQNSGNSSTGYGAGGGGAVSGSNQPAIAGSVGRPAILIIYEYS